MHGTLRRIAAVLAAAVGVAHASPMVTVADTPKGIEMRWAADQTPLLMPRDYDYIEPIANGLRPTSRVEPADHGFDLVLNYHNSFTTPRTTANVEIGPFILGDRIDWRDFRFTGASQLVTLASVPASSHNYPGDLYSPVATLENDRFAIGLSFMYPVLEYEHQVNIALRTRTGKRAQGIGGQGFFVRFDTSIDAKRPDQRRYPAMLEPGESREYRIAVRVVEKSADEPKAWVKTLEPYASEFVRQHGPVRYQRDPRPVFAVVVAGDFLQGPDNPFGFGRFRPDRNGWRPLLDWIRSRGSLERIMVWAPSGMHPSRQNNYPFHFATQLERTSTLREAFDPVRGFQSLRNSGMDVGMWWGHAGWYLEGWDAPTKVGFDPDNPEHVQAAFDEIRAAQRAGATSIGMDAFSADGIPLWVAYDWVQRLQSEFPDLRFIVEPKSNDVLHNLSPMYLRAFEFNSRANTPDDLLLLDSPHYLADLLNPGHETWAALRWDRHKALLGAAATESLMIRDSEHAARYGFVPLIHEDIRNRGSFRAQDSWLESIPRQLHMDLVEIAAARAGDKVDCPYCGSDTICEPARRRMQRESQGASTGSSAAGPGAAQASSADEPESRTRSGARAPVGNSIAARIRANLEAGTDPVRVVSEIKEQPRIVRLRSRSESRD